jgi:hypothetical protein
MVTENDTFTMAHDVEYDTVGDSNGPMRTIQTREEWTVRMPILPDLLRPPAMPVVPNLLRPPDFSAYEDE